MLMDLRSVLSYACSIVFDNSGGGAKAKDEKAKRGGGFRMPLHYPRYKREDYLEMEEWKLDLLLQEYGLSSFQAESVDQKRNFAIGAFTWD